MLRKTIIILICLATLSGCVAEQISPETTAPTMSTTSVPSTHATEETPTETTQQAEVDGFDPYAIIDSMSLETLIGQLFLGSCPGKYSAIEDITAFQPGGFVLFGNDFQDETPDSLCATLSSYQDASTIPMLFAVDEEGGTVIRISRYSQFRANAFPSPRELYSQGGIDLLLATEAEKCRLLDSLGIHVNLGPVCDITTNPNSFMYRRSLGLSPQDTGNAITSVIRTMSLEGIGSVLKHFPGYGDNADTHTDSALDSRSLQYLEENDLVPFVAGINAGCDAIMISHTVIAALDEIAPASLSPAVHQYIREQMGFDGVLMTDDLIMDAISDTYGDEEAAVLAILAGNDMLCTGAFQEQYPAVLGAVQSGRIPIDTVKESVARILLWKNKLGLIS